MNKIFILPLFYAGKSPFKLSSFLWMDNKDGLEGCALCTSVIKGTVQPDENCLKFVCLDRYE